MTLRKVPAPWVFLALVLILTIALRIRLLNVPLERDEGEYAYAGQLILAGVPPYRMAWNMKLPGTYAAYAAIMAAFGQSIAAIHVGLLLVNAGAIIFVYLIGRRLLNPLAGVTAAASYALLSISASVYGTQAHATHFVVLPALAATWLLLRGLDSGRSAAFFWSGLLYGIAFIMKQHGIFLVLFGALYIAWRRPSWRRFLLFACAAAIPFGVTCFILWRAGVFPKFWFWVFRYAGTYASEVSPALGAKTFAINAVRVILPNLPLWLLAAAGVILVYKKRETRAAAAFLASFLLFSFLAICPGLYFREHYFVLMLPCIALLAGAAVALADQRIPNQLAPWIFAGIMMCTVFVQRDFLFRMNPMQASRKMYGPGPFPQAVEVAKYIRKHSTQDARIGLLGSEPEINFYADRRSASGFLYTYPMMELQPYAVMMQQEFVRDLESAQPEYMVYLDVQASWLLRQGSVNLVFEWWKQYCPAHYEKVMVADLVTPDETDYYWDEAARNYVPNDTPSVTVYRRTASKPASLP